MKKFFFRFLIFLFFALSAGLWYAYPLLRVGSGYAAKMACSCHFLQGRSLEDIAQNDLNFSALPWVSLSFEGEDGVAASFFGLARQQARFLPHTGCYLLSDEAQPIGVQARKASPQSATPLEVWTTLPGGTDSLALHRALDAAMQPVEGGASRAVLVLYQGKVVAQRYAKGFDEEALLLGWSMTKSVTGTLVGMAIKNGHLDLYEDQLFKAWNNDVRKDIRLIDLLHMNSGLDWNEAYGGVSDATTMLYTAPNMGKYAMEKPSAHRPDSAWVYSSGTTNILSVLLQERLGSAAYHSLLYDSLFAKLGMHTALIEQDQSGHFVGSSYGWATAPDWAKLGQLYLQNGVWNGDTLLPPNWVAMAQQPTAGSNGVYGLQTWLKSEDLPNAPANVLLFRGFQDQRLAILPSHNAVILRLGMNKDKAFDMDALIKDVVRALPI